jgi:hypothetical protein
LELFLRVGTCKAKTWEKLRKVMSKVLVVQITKNPVGMNNRIDRPPTAIVQAHSSNAELLIQIKLVVCINKLVLQIKGIH